jgi:hypothetical protein
LSFCLLIFREQVYLRYVVPALPLFCLAAAYVFTCLGSHTLFTALGAPFVALNVLRLPVGCYALTWFPAQATLSESARVEFVRAAQPEQLAAEALRRLTSPYGGGTAILELNPVIARAPANAVTATWHSNALYRTWGLTGPSGLLQQLLARNIEWLIVPANSQSELIKAAALASDAVWTVGTVQMRRLNPSRIEMPELLSDVDFRRAAETWSIAPDAVDATRDGVWVTLKRPAFQRIPARPGTGLRLQYVYDCPQPIQIRAQVNWHDAADRFVSTSIKITECSGERRMEARFKVPATATQAMVFAVPNEEGQVLIRRVSAKLDAGQETQ